VNENFSGIHIYEGKRQFENEQFLEFFVFFKIRAIFLFGFIEFRKYMSDVAQCP